MVGSESGAAVVAASVTNSGAVGCGSGSGALVEPFSEGWAVAITEIGVRAKEVLRENRKTVRDGRKRKRGFVLLLQPSIAKEKD